MPEEEAEATGWTRTGDAHAMRLGCPSCSRYGQVDWPVQVAFLDSCAVTHALIRRISSAGTLCHVTLPRRRHIFGVAPIRRGASTPIDVIYPRGRRDVQIFEQARSCLVYEFFFFEFSYCCNSICIII